MTKAESYLSTIQPISSSSLSSVLRSGRLPITRSSLAILSFLTFILGTSPFGNSSVTALAQSGNQSDITGVDVVETGVNVVPPSNAGFLQSTDVDQTAVDQQITNPATPPIATFTLQSQSLTVNYSPLLQLLGIELQGTDPSPSEIAQSLALLANLTGNNANYIQVSATGTGQLVTTRIAPNQSLSPNSLHPKGSPIPEFSSWKTPLNLARTLKSLDLPALIMTQKELTSPAPEVLVNRYIAPSVEEGKTAQLMQLFSQQIQTHGNLTNTIGQQLYKLLIEPMEADLVADGVDTLVLAMSPELIGLPIAALNDGEQFLVDKYAVTIVPSFGLSDIGFTDIRTESILAMGSETFSDQADLPSVPAEINALLQVFPGRSLLNNNFTVNNFVQAFKEMSAQGDPPGIVHLATHGEFAPSDYRQSYIRFGDRPVSMLEFRNLTEQLGWDVAETAPDLLVLSACRTAVGDPVAELGFGGLAVASGAKSAVASLWYVSDVGTLALMQEFYDALKVTGLKSLALQQAQQHLQRGETRLESGKIRLSSGQLLDLPPEVAEYPDQDFQDPYYWAAFTLIGNWN